MKKHLTGIHLLIITILSGLSFTFAPAHADTGAMARALATVNCGPTYVVRSGDTLSAIAQRCGVSTASLTQANGLRITSVIYPGQQLAIPYTTAYQSGIGAPGARSSAAAGCPASYTVRAGDTLSIIARRCGLSVANLKQWNALRSDMIWIGQTLSLRAPQPPANPAYQAVPPRAFGLPIATPVVMPTPTPCIESTVSPW